jgi:hypothetical protein
MLTVRFRLETLNSVGTLVVGFGDGEANILNGREDSSRESSLFRGNCNFTSAPTFPSTELFPLSGRCDTVDPDSSSLLDDIVLELELELS